MSMTKIGFVAFAIVFVLTVNYFGNYLGYTVQGVPQGGAVSGAPSIGDLSFMWDLMTFQIDNAPVFAGVLFIFINLMSVVVLVSTVLPGGG